MNSFDAVNSMIKTYYDNNKDSVAIQDIELKKLNDSLRSLDELFCIDIIHVDSYFSNDNDEILVIIDTPYAAFNRTMLLNMQRIFSCTENIFVKNVYMSGIMVLSFRFAYKNVFVER